MMYKKNHVNPEKSCKSCLMNITVLYVGSSLLAPLKSAEREINRVYKLDLRVAAYNFGSPLSDS